MRSTIRQITAMSRTTLLSIPRRLAISLSMVGSIMLVVCVLSGFLAMARGFEITLQSAGSPDVAVVLGGGPREEGNSEIPPDVIRSLMATRGDIGVLRNDRGVPILSREIVVPVEFRTDPDAVGETLALRGMDETGPGVRAGVTLSSGRPIQPGTREIIVGEQLAARYSGLGVGNRVRLGPVNWIVVGHFSSFGSALESEIWGDIDAVAAAFNRVGEVQSLRLRLAVTDQIDGLSRAAAEFVGAQLIALTEAELYASQSAGTARLVRYFGWPIVLLMAIGATAGALNTMMSSVSDRTVEIATVRAMGFSRVSACLATWLEAVLLSVVGVGLGLATSWLMMNGWEASTMGANGTSLAFQLVVGRDAMVEAALVGLAIGAVGGAVPAFAAARLPVTDALRGRG
ncbi:ABC transporter permease [Ruegeria sp. EL01]|jgi:putative ABC transport system permease protein|uniref:ABC transporter permease n=1 Tax=Ruegeria sp. EL01 TaxID=2107578 RepID=UPI000EA82270|nr:ABC transporter permease [Ruegeria sp. EL01]